MIAAVTLDIAFVKWELVAAALLLLIAGLIWRGKRWKQALVFLLVTYVLLALAFMLHYTAFLLLDFSSGGVSLSQTWLQAVDLIVAWGPTVLFVFILFVATMFGIWRGFRKSAIFAIHAICAATVCLIFFFVSSNNAHVDAGILSGINAVMGGEGALQAQLGVSADCITLRQVLAEWLPSLFGYGNEVSLIVSANGAYLLTLADMAFRIMMAVVLLVVYWILLFLLWIVYHIAYPERRYKRRKARQIQDNTTDRAYCKHRFAGGIVGFVRGLATGLTVLSLLGGVLFMAVGTGDGNAKEFSFGDPDTDNVYSVYRSVEKYGDTGIYKFLNLMKGTDNSPYYLFAADLIFSGKLDDQTNGVSANIKFRKEIGAYTEFARKTWDMLIEYGGEETLKAIASGGDMSAVYNIMTLPGFQAEFESLIDDFDAQTYIINFAMSAVNMLLANIDNVSFGASMNQPTRELCKILFRKGYLSDSIPDERDMQSGADTGKQPYIGMSQILNKNDAKIVYRMVVSLLTSDASEGGTLETVKTLLPLIPQLSVFDTSRADELNPVLGRVYCFLANTYLTAEGEEGVYYSDVVNAKVSWVDELSSLISVAQDGISLYQSIQAKEGDTLHKLLSVFDEDDADYAENIRMYDSAANAIADSALLGQVLRTSYMHKLLTNALSSVGSNLYLPPNIVFENTTSDSTTTPGELYQLVYGLRLLGQKSNREFLDKMTSGGMSDLGDIFSFMGNAVNNTDEHGNSLSEYLTESVLLRSVISSLMMEKGGDTLYVPETVLERDESGNPVQLIQKETLQQLFVGLSAEGVCDTVVSFIQGDSDIGDILEKEEILQLFEMGNGILEGTVAKTMISSLQDNDFAVMPSALMQPEGWLTVGASSGELRKLAQGVRVSSIKLGELLNGGDTDKIMDAIGDLSKEGIEALLQSDILHYSVSEQVRRMKVGDGDSSGGFKMIIPVRSLIDVSTNRPDVHEVIAQSELVALLSQMSLLDIDSDSNVGTVLHNLAINKSVLQESFILGASIVHYIMQQNMDEYISDAYKVDGQESALENFYYDNAWWRELPNFVDAIDVLLELDKADDGFTLDADTLTNKLGTTMDTFNDTPEGREATKLQICYQSNIILYNLTKKLDEAIGAWELEAVNDKIIAAAKVGNNYSLTELTALVNAVKIFELGDVFADDFDDNLQDRMLENIYSLNDDFGGKTKLEAIYPSKIISAVVSSDIEDAFKDYVENDVRARLKDGFEIYTVEEMGACLTAAKELSIEWNSGDEEENVVKMPSFTDLSEYKNKLDVLCASRLVAGSITKAIKDTSLVHHDKAYEKDFPGVYKAQEIRVLIEFMDENGKDESGQQSSDMTNFTVGNMYIMRQYVCEGDEPQSYLIAASVADTLFANSDLYIPSSVVADGIIRPSELANLFAAYEILDLGDNAADIGDWNIDMKVPDKEQVEFVLDSEILRATITHSIYAANTYAKVGKDNVTVSDRVQKSSVSRYGAPTLSETQLRIMFDFLRENSESGSFKLPTISVNMLSNLTEDDLQCDILRYQVGEYIFDFTQSYVYGETKDEILVMSYTDTEVYALSAMYVSHAFGETSVNTFSPQNTVKAIELLMEYMSFPTV